MVSIVSPTVLRTVSMVCCMLYVMPLGLCAICYGFVGISHGPICNILSMVCCMGSPRIAYAVYPIYWGLYFLWLKSNLLLSLWHFLWALILIPLVSLPFLMVVRVVSMVFTMIKKY